jgi:hypothetical protein
MYGQPTNIDPRIFIGVVHRRIPHGGVCPPAGGVHGGTAGGVHGGGGQYPWSDGGGEVLEL